MSHPTVPIISNKRDLYSLLAAENISSIFNLLLLYCVPFDALDCLFSFIISAVITSLLQRLPKILSEGKNTGIEGNNLETNMRLPLQQYCVDSLIWNILSYLLTYGRGGLCLCQFFGRNR